MGDDNPVYVGYTNRTVKQRFKEHLKDKDFSNYSAVRVVELNRYEKDFNFTWDYLIIQKDAEIVDNTERYLISKYGTQNSSHQVMDNGGQNWNDVKHFVLCNRGNPRFEGMTGSEIKRHLKNEKRLKIDLRHFISHVDLQEKNDLSHFINHIDLQEKIDLKNFISHVDLQEKINLESFVGSINPQGKIDLRDFVNRIDSQELINLRNFINNINLREKIDLRNFVSDISPKEKIDLRNFIKTIDPQEKINLKDFIKSIDSQEKINLKHFIINIKGE